MKRTAIAVVLGSMLAVLAAGSSAQVVIDDAGTRLPVRSTHADTYRETPANTATAFPSAADESGVRLPSASTRADRHRARSGGAAITAESAFPESVDEAGNNLQPMLGSAEADESPAN